LPAWSARKRTETAQRDLRAPIPVEADASTCLAEPVQIRIPRMRLTHGIALVPRGREAQGIFRGALVRENIVLSASASSSRGGSPRLRPRTRKAQEFVRRCACDDPDPRKARPRSERRQPAEGQSSPNGSTHARGVFLFDEPTAASMSAARLEVYRLMGELLSRGRPPIVMISSELPEIPRPSATAFSSCAIGRFAASSRGEATGGPS
jgi:ABC-type sugar transport system ATPase subunit